MKIKIVIAGLLAIIYGSSMQACIIGLTNDSNKPLLIVTDDFKEGMLLPAGGFVEFGSKKYMANFRIMQQEGNHFTQHYHAQQTACTPAKYTKVKVSEITPNTTSIPFKVSVAEQKQIPNNSGCGCGN